MLKSSQKSSKSKLSKNDIFKAVDEVHYRVEVAYSVIIMILGYGIVAFRDPKGIRPVSYTHLKLPTTPYV